MQWIDKYLWFTSCQGLELHLLPDNSYSGRICHVSLNKNLLTIGAKHEVEGDIACVLKKVSPGEPLAVTLTGKGILIRKITGISELSEDSLNRVFPNLAVDNFYFQHFRSAENSFVALARKDMIDELINNIQSAGIKLLNISLGPFITSCILSQINTYGNEFHFDNHIIRFRKGFEWDDYQYTPQASSEFPIKVDREQLPERSVIAYATAFQLALLNHLEPVTIETEITSKTLAEFREEKKFKFSVATMLSICFLLLLVNFLVFSRYHALNEELQLEANKSSAGEVNIRSLEQDVAAKEQLLHDLGWNKGLKAAFLADQIGQSVPSSVTLDELTINPRLKSNTPTEGKKYSSNQIRISGKTINLQAVNEWIYKLKDKTWVKQVVLERYSPDGEDQQDNRPKFVLRINI